MARLLPTTKTQVSGHRFLRRRVEHGLILGDIRMIHDPLSSRRRAMIFGVVAVVMISGVMGLFAWMRPNPNPGEAAIIRAADGSLFARVDETVHPVTNLTSARLIVGGPEDPVRASVAKYSSPAACPLASGWHLRCSRRRTRRRRTGQRARCRGRTRSPR